MGVASWVESSEESEDVEEREGDGGGSEDGADEGCEVSLHLTTSSVS